MPIPKQIRVATALLVALCWATAARAQQPPQPTSTGPLVLEPLHNGFLLAPDVKITKLDGKIGTLAGAYAGWIKDDRLFIGGGAYWRADRKGNADDLAYGGLIVGWFVAPNRPVSFSAKGLVGLGQVSQPFSVQPFNCDVPEHSMCSSQQIPTVDGGFDQRFRFRSDFVIVEPEFDVQAKLSNRVRLSAGAGYRLVDAAQGLDRSVRGATGSVSVQVRLGK